MKPTVLLVNPWIYDFAAYDLWAKPMGLLYLASRLRESGLSVYLIDCLNVHHPLMGETAYAKKPLRRLYGTGKYWKHRVPKPQKLSSIQRQYSRYGIDPQAFQKDLKSVKRPAAALVTSLMTYWYPGAFEAIGLIKDMHPDVPVLLGGIYATLCPEHARTHSQADFVIPSPSQYWPAKLDNILQTIIPNLQLKKKVEPFTPYPAFDLLTNIEYVCISGSFGCPFRCAYCASPYLSSPFLKRDPLALFEEVLYWHKHYRVRDFAFYDDALLTDSHRHICVFLEEVLRRNLDIRFHCPNGIHITYIDRDVAKLLFKAGFKTIRLGLETSDPQLQDHLGRKFATGEFERAVALLKSAGFRSDQLGVYLLMGLPGQSYEQVAKTIAYVGQVGAVPYLSEYSPIPHTELWKAAVETSRFDLASEPLFHNNSILPCWSGEALEKVGSLKAMVREIREKNR
ncbi:MAG: radical SAM protein [Deltaproteobacteria bacterium]|nr:radical SAM protein [Deltaproteobacteria bacterium]